MAPDNSLILTCHSSVLLASEYESISSGHFHCGKFNIAKVGTKNDIVPPCTSGSLNKNAFM